MTSGDRPATAADLPHSCPCGERWSGSNTAHCGLPERFWSKVDKTGDCWEWTAYVARATGYGRFTIDGRAVNVHRLAYASLVGDIPDGDVVRHVCDNRKCVKPAHLELGSTADNNRDMIDRQRAAWHTRYGWKRRWTDSQYAAILAAAPNEVAGVADAMGMPRNTAHNYRWLARKRGFTHATTYEGVEE